MVLLSDKVYIWYLFTASGSMMFLKFDVYQEKIFLQIPQNKTGAPQNKRGTVICSNHCKEKETSQTNYQYLASTTHI